MRILWWKRNPSSLLMGSQIGASTLKVWRILNELEHTLPYDSAMPLLGICLEDLTFYSTDICSAIFITSLFTITRKWKQPTCLQLTNE